MDKYLYTKTEWGIFPTTYIAGNPLDQTTKDALVFEAETSKDDFSSQLIFQF